MSWTYFVKCISFQNQFWSIIFYTIALVFSLSMIFIDEAVFILETQTSTSKNLAATTANISAVSQVILENDFNLKYTKSRNIFLFKELSNLANICNRKGSIKPIGLVYIRYFH